MKKIFLLVIQIALLPICLLAQSLPTPKEHFGFTIGEPYMLANFSQTEAYFKKIAELSDRVEYRSIGQTEFGREQPLLVITAPKNFPQIERFKEISRKLGRAERPNGIKIFLCCIKSMSGMTITGIFS